MFKLKLQILFDIKLEENVQLYRDYHFLMRKFILNCGCVKIVFSVRTVKKCLLLKSTRNIVEAKKKTRKTKYIKEQ